MSIALIKQTLMGLADCLTERRFKRIKPRLFVLRLGAEMELFVELNLFGGVPTNNIACDIGLTSRRSLSFAIDALKSHGGQVYRQSTWRPDPFNTRCQVGHVCGWGPRTSLRISDYEEAGLVTRFIADLDTHILPQASRCDDPSRYFELLGQDDRLFPWLHCNGAMRAAEFIFWGRKLGKTQTELNSVLANYDARVRSGLGRDVKDEDFIGAVAALYDSSRAYIE